jgi:hypothetical protein
VLQDEQIGRSHDEHHYRVAVEPIAEPAPSGQGEVFLHGQRGNVADAATLEVSRARVMDGMARAPHIVRRQRDCADHAADPIISSAAAKERPVPAVVLDHEESHKEACGRYSHEEARPITEAQSCPRQEPEHDEAECREQKLKSAAG